MDLYCHRCGKQLQYYYHCPPPPPKKQNTMKFRKKLEFIEAVKFTRDAWDSVVEFTNGKATSLLIEKTPCGQAYCIVTSLGCEMLANEGDWIIKSTNGEYYPCKPNIFISIYEPIN